MRYLQKRKSAIPVYTVADLAKPETLQYLANDLVEKYRLTMRAEPIKYDELSIRELTALARMGNPEIKETMKRCNKETYKQDNRLYSKIIGRYTDQYKNTEALLIEKCRELINS